MTVKMTHPGIPGSEFDSPDSAVPFHRAAGWVPVDEVAEQVEGQVVEQPETPPSEQDKTPKGRRASTKEGE